jgi:hypothetical protein
MSDTMKPKLSIDKRIFHDMSWFIPPFALQIDDQTREPVQSEQSMRSS